MEPFIDDSKDYTTILFSDFEMVIDKTFRECVYLQDISQDEN